ncbi:MAG TPA: VOC family protein, partial [Bdellovibrio sp.]
MALEFLDLLFIDLTEKQIALSAHWDIDHLCYRSDSLGQYDDLKNSFATFANLLIESDVNGRPIATYKLNQALQFKDWMIDVVELPAPKASKPTTAGFEHIEVVCDVPFTYFEKNFSHLNLHTEG